MLLVDPPISTGINKYNTVDFHLFTCREYSWHNSIMMMMVGILSLI